MNETKQGGLPKISTPTRGLQTVRGAYMQAPASTKAIFTSYSDMGGSLCCGWPYKTVKEGAVN